MEWMLILTLGWATSILTNDQGTSGGRLAIPMQNEAACTRAMRHDYKGIGEVAFCINTMTGEVKQ